MQNANTVQIIFYGPISAGFGEFGDVQAHRDFLWLHRPEVIIGAEGDIIPYVGSVGALRVRRQPINHVLVHLRHQVRQGRVWTGEARILVLNVGRASNHSEASGTWEIRLAKEHLQESC